MLSAPHIYLRESVSLISHCNGEHDIKFWSQGHFNVKETYQLYYILPAPSVGFIVSHQYYSTTPHDLTLISYFAGRLVGFHSLQYNENKNQLTDLGQVIHHNEQFVAFIFCEGLNYLCVVSEESALGNLFIDAPISSYLRDIKD